MVDQWPLTGRAEELRLIGEALSGEDQCGIVIAGPAGVGKTRLARAAADAAAAAGWSLHRIAGTATGRAVTLGAFARWADGADASPLALARRVFAGLTDGGTAPLLLIVDDAHLLDDLSALIVHQLVMQESVNAIATIRAATQAPDAVTALWKDGLLRRLELQPLSRNESDHLLQTVLGGSVSSDCARRVWTLSRGNVLFLHHLVEHGRQTGSLVRAADEWRWVGAPSLSPSLVDIVELQIGAISDDVRDVVDLVAIAEPVDRTMLSSLADHVAIEAAERHGLIAANVDTDNVFVGHPLYGEIRLSQCGPLRLRRLRARVASAMAQTERADPLRLGLLWLESDLPPDADRLTLAANIAASRLDLPLAERLSRAAAEAQPSPAAKLQLAYILYLQEKGQAAEELLDTLSTNELAAPGFIDGVILRAANLLLPLRSPAASRAVVDAAVALGDQTRNHALLTFRAVGQAMAAESRAAIETMTEVDRGELDSYGLVLGYAAETIALGDLGRTAEAQARADDGYRVLEESPQESFHASGLAEFHAYALLAAGYVADADVVAERSHRQYAAHPGMSRSMSIAALGMTALARGDLIAAKRRLDTAKESFGSYGDVAGLLYRFRILETEVLARLGLVDDAAAALEATRESRHPAYDYVESTHLLAATWVSAASDRLTEARELCRRAVEFARERGQLAREVLALQTTAQLGESGGAERLAELADLVEGPRAPLAARHARALAGDDATELDAVSQEWETVGDVLAAADAAAQAAAVHRRAGRRGSALTSSARAHLLASRCGGAVSPALSATRVRLPFTPRELEITTLLSRGLSNRAIAEATSLSVRTVEGHIYQATAKAGVASRAELATLVQQFNTKVPPPAS